MDDLLTVKDVMRIFQVTQQTIYNWMRDGRLRSYKIGATRRFKMKDVEALFQSGQRS